MEMRNSDEFRKLFVADPQMLGVDAVKGSELIFPVVFKTLRHQAVRPDSRVPPPCPARPRRKSPACRAIPTASSTPSGETVQQILRDARAFTAEARHNMTRLRMKPQESQSLQRQTRSRGLREDALSRALNCLQQRLRIRHRRQARPSAANQRPRCRCPRRRNLQHRLRQRLRKSAWDQLLGAIRITVLFTAKRATAVASSRPPPAPSPQRPPAPDPAAAVPAPARSCPHRAQSAPRSRQRIPAYLRRSRDIPCGRSMPPGAAAPTAAVGFPAGVGESCSGLRRAVSAPSGVCPTVLAAASKKAPAVRS